MPIVFPIEEILNCNLCGVFSLPPFGEKINLKQNNFLYYNNIFI